MVTLFATDLAFGCSYKRFNSSPSKSIQSHLKITNWNANSPWISMLLELLIIHCSIIRRAICVIHFASVLSLIVPRIMNDQRRHAWVGDGFAMSQVNENLFQKGVCLFFDGYLRGRPLCPLSSAKTVPFFAAIRTNFDEQADWRYMYSGVAPAIITTWNR